MIFFWALFDSSFMYMAPLVITQSGYTNTFMGLILGSSSLFGALFDVLLSKYLKNTNYRRIYLVMILVCFLCPALLMQGQPIFVYITAMALWGLYYDLFNFGNLDYVSRSFPKEEHAQGFGILWIGRALGYTIAPLLVGSLVIYTIDFKPYILMWFFITGSALLFTLLLFRTKKHQYEYIPSTENKILLKKLPELLLWKKLGKLLFPVLILTTFFWVYEAFFWTLGPLMTAYFESAGILGGLFLTLYTLPMLVVGFLVGRATTRFGKKKTALLSLFLSSCILCGFFIFQNPFMILILVLFASSCVAFTMPSLSGAYADYVEEAPHYEKEIEALQDFATNIGYIIGPILAGLLSDLVGNLTSFSYLGIAGILIVLFVTFTSPKHITIKM